jgi:hypothetical protein
MRFWPVLLTCGGLVAVIVGSVWLPIARNLPRSETVVALIAIRRDSCSTFSHSQDPEQTHGPAVNLVELDAPRKPHSFSIGLSDR